MYTDRWRQSGRFYYIFMTLNGGNVSYVIWRHFSDKLLNIKKAFLKKLFLQFPLIENVYAITKQNFQNYK